MAIAAKKPISSKLTSLIEHKANPDMTGRRLKFTYSPVCSPKNPHFLLNRINYFLCIIKVHMQNDKTSVLSLPKRHLDINTVKRGAELLIVSVKLTAT